MVIFHSYVAVYQRVRKQKPSKAHHISQSRSPASAFVVFFSHRGLRPDEQLHHLRTATDRREMQRGLTSGERLPPEMSF